MTDVPDLMQQAEVLLHGRYLTDKDNSACAEDGAQATFSTLTLKSYTAALGQAGTWARQHHGISRLHEMTPDMAYAYLRMRIKNGLGQKQVDNDRIAMQLVVGKLKRLQTNRKTKPRNRFYTAVQIDRIAARQNPSNHLATRIARNAGLRARELLTLRRPDEAHPSDGRSSHPHLFLGRSGVRYVVTGHRGRRRHVMIDHPLALTLEACRLPTPELIVDRGLDLQKVYAIGGGAAWSTSFCKISKADLGWSAGAEGLRYSYAHARLGKLQTQGLSYEDAKLILSQELGQSRQDSVNIFIR